MEKKNRFISATYQLYSVAEGNKELVEQTSEANPFQFITGFGIALDAFEQHVAAMEQGQEFDFIVQPEDAFGIYDPAGVIKMERDAFNIDGKFDKEHIYPKAVITLVNSEQQYQMATVVKVEDDGVTLDTNHPYAGQTLNFTGKVVENREATEAEVEGLIRQLTGGCGGCGGGCKKEGCKEGDCDCKGGNCEGDGCCN